MPSPVPQPKLKLAGPVPAGAAVRSTVTSATVPPSAQAPTAHWAACPRSSPRCSGTTPTHKVAGPVAAVTLASVDAEEADGVGVAVVADGVGVTVVAVSVGAGVDVVAVPVGAAVLEVAVAVPDAVAVAVAVAVADAGVRVADGLGEAVGACSASHDSLSPGVTAGDVTATVVAAASRAAAAKKPAEAVSTVPPATRAAAVRRTRVKRM